MIILHDVDHHRVEISIYTRLDHFTRTIKHTYFSVHKYNYDIVCELRAVHGHVYAYGNQSVHQKHCVL